MTTMDPYLTPQGELISDSDAVGEIQVFSSACRIGRVRYLAHVFLASLAFWAVSAALVAIVGERPALMGGISLLLVVGFVGVVWIFLLQRLHDLNRSGWWSLLMCVPIVNIAFSFYVSFWPGTASNNRFGLKPPGPKAWHWVTALLFPILAALTAVSIAIPMYMVYNGANVPPAI